MDKPPWLKHAYIMHMHVYTYTYLANTNAFTHLPTPNHTAMKYPCLNN